MAARRFLTTSALTRRHGGLLAAAPLPEASGLADDLSLT
jgi:hypothetical protein